MTFSFPSEIASIDSDFSGYTDRLYAVDSGGNLWRFDVGDALVSNWNATKIFSANPGYPNGILDSNDKGRKVFYKPAVVSELGYKMVYFGTGDREHPLNTPVIDRIYAVKDPVIPYTGTTENNLLDVTSDLLQDPNADASAINAILTQLNNARGWYIRLENTGEKVLAAPTVFNKVLYVTTYSPSAVVNNACTGNLGEARLYAMDYKTGEAVYNYASNNVVTTNSRAIDSSGNTMTKGDRSVYLGSGIPSGVVVIISPGGQTSVITGVGGRIASAKTKSGGTIIPIYWRQKK